MKIRTQDKWGAGHFGASRGERKHMGVDLVVEEGSSFVAMNSGIVSKFGQVYKDSPQYKYISVISEGGIVWRYMYLNSCVQIGQRVEAGETILGTYDSLEPRYPGITPHVHLDIKNFNNEYIDPTPIIENWLDKN